MDDLLLVPTRNVHHSEKYKDFWFSEKPKTKTRFCFLFFDSIVLFLTFVVFPFLRLKCLIKKCFQKK